MSDIGTPGKIKSPGSIAITLGTWGEINSPGNLVIACKKQTDTYSYISTTNIDRFR